MADPRAEIRAAGAVLWRRNGRGLEVAVVHRPRYDDWSLPKGKIDDGETAPAAAVREVGEETGFRVALGRRLGEARYLVQAPAKRTGPKVVEYWAARAVGGAFAANAEVDQLRWLTPADAAGLLSYDYDRNVLRSFTALPVPTATVLLVRHGEAGERSKWTGDDELRPLTAEGLRQTERLTDLLCLFGPSMVHSAPRLRCTQTVAPLAEALGVDIIEEPRLAEEGYWPDRAAGRARLLQIADLGGTAAVCSQGGVIPDLIFTLAGRAAADDHGDIPSPKGSTWVLSMHGRQLLAADYYAQP
jgi:8-oxo-dGTP pyrophosphatase MutT (NUDIX family)